MGLFCCTLLPVNGWFSTYLFSGGYVAVRMKLMQRTKLQEDNIFSYVCLSTGWSHVTITPLPDALDLTVQPLFWTWAIAVQSLTLSYTPDLGPHCLGEPPSPHKSPAHRPSVYSPPPFDPVLHTLDMGLRYTRQDWRLVQTCSLKDLRPPPPTTADILWQLKKRIRPAQAGGTHPAEMLSC